MLLGLRSREFGPRRPRCDFFLTGERCSAGAESDIVGAGQTQTRPASCRPVLRAPLPSFGCWGQLANCARVTLSADSCAARWLSQAARLRQRQRQPAGQMRMCYIGGSRSAAAGASAAAAAAAAYCPYAPDARQHLSPERECECECERVRAGRV